MLASVITLPLLLAAGALATPHAGAGKHVKRAVVTETDYTVVYETYYVTESGVVDVATATSAAAVVSSATVKANNLGLAAYGAWTGYRHGSQSAPATTLSTLTLSSTTTVAPSTRTIVSSTPVTTSAAAPSTSSSTSTSTSTSTRAVVISATSAQPTPSSSTRAATASSSTSASAVPSSSNSPSQDYINRVLLHHNVHRANHSAPDAVWSPTMYAIALTEASNCNYKHNTSYGGGGYGQNIAAGVQSANIGVVITDLFYNSEVNWYAGQYGLANPSFDNFEHWGHFSQVVWKASTNIACATVDCTGPGLIGVNSNVAPYFTVCNYQAVGNMGGEYGNNVGAPLGRATVSGSYTG